MSIPEWAVIILATVTCAVIGWGIKRLVKANDDTSTALTKISDLLADMDVRQSKSETWMELHEKQDDERHQETQKSHESIWKTIEGLRA